MFADIYSKAYRKTFRGANHAGEWYTNNAPQLAEDLTGWLGQVRPRREDEQFPIPGCKAIIAPHAGYAYSGATAAWAFKCIDTSITKRVIIVGPSHHYHLAGCALTGCDTYETPLGSLPVDVKVVEELRATGKFETMSCAQDELEHSIEMELPFLRKVCEGKDIKIVPVLVGSLTKELEMSYGALLAPYLAEEGTLLICSSDFCHWGHRFSYTFYYPMAPPSRVEGYHLTRASPPEPDFPIYKSITRLDHYAMSLLSFPPGNARAALSSFHEYLEETGNTICGRHAIGLLLGTFAGIQELTGQKPLSRWVKYDQSSQVTNIRESSVSYACAYFTLAPPPQPSIG